MLEKSRVVTRAKGERSFHSFYQLLKGKSDQELCKKNFKFEKNYKIYYLQYSAALGLTRNPANYYYLALSECHEVETIDDVADYKHVQKSLDTLGFTSEDKDTLSKVVAGILHLGNLKYQQEGKEMKIVNNDGKNFSIFFLFVFKNKN